MKKRVFSFVLALCFVVGVFPAFETPAQAATDSGWVLETAVPAGAEITQRKWTYTKTTYTSSTSTSLSGYTQYSSEWVKSGSGSVEYATFPAGFDTGHSYYTSMAKSAYSGYENATSKRTVSNSWQGYIYWHWMYDCGGANAYYRTIYDRYGTASYNGYVYKYFGAFKSSSSYTATGNTSYSCGTYGYKTYYNTGRTSYADSQGSMYWYRFDYYKSSYTDYYKKFYYYKTEQLESTSAISESSSSSVVISNVKTYVKYKEKFTISYNANGGTNAPAAQTKTFGTALTITSAVPTREGYDFLGWSTSSSALAPSYAPGGRFTSESDYTLYAVWQPKTRYTVTYDYKTNGGTSCVQGSDSVYEGGVAGLAVTAAKSGWNFVGWNTNRDAKTGLSSLVVNDNVTLYVIFNKEVNVRIYTEANKLLTAQNQTYYNCAEGAEITLPQIPNYLDWMPTCWVRGSDKAEFAAGDRVVISENEEFYAKYVKTLSLSYEANGGSVAPASQVVALYYTADGSYDQEKPVLAGAIQRPGYSFDKWAYGSAEGETYSAGDTIFMENDVVMYATWTELPALDAPVISVADDMEGKLVSIDAMEGAIIYYTLDGSSPTTQSTVYDGAILLNTAGEYMVKAKAVRAEFADSPVVLQTGNIVRAAAPASSCESGYVRVGTSIALSNQLPGAMIYYTTDGSVPSRESTRYEAPIIMDEDMELSAVVFAPGYAVSECATYQYKQAPIYAVDMFGYSFVNAAASFGYASTMPSFLNYCIPYSSVKIIFGDSVKGKAAYTSMAKYAWSGNCCGMTSTSALMFSTDTSISAEQFGQATVNQLRHTDTAPAYGDLPVRTFIEAMQIAQYTVQFDRDYGGNKVSNVQLHSGENIDFLYSSVKAHLEQGKNDIIAVGKSGVGAHALLAYDLIAVSDTESKLYVYDCNYPNDPYRYVSIRMDDNGNYTDWSYDMGGYGVWGSESEGNSYISFIPFDTILYIWENRGRLFDEYLTLTVDSENVAIYNLDRELVGEFRDGEFYSQNDEVFAIPNLNMSTESDFSVYLPEDYYVVTNRDGGDFEASMVGDTIGATVETNAETVCFGLDESLRLNDIAIEQAGHDSNYTISLDSSYINTNNLAVFKNVTISGSGVGETLRLSSGASGTPIIENCNIGSYKVNGVEQINYVISASAGRGGTISPKGDISVAAGSNKTFKITPDQGYKIKDVLVDGYSVGAESEFVFEEVGKDHMIRATFEPAFSVDSISVNDKGLSVAMKNDSAAKLCVAVYTADGQLVLARLIDVVRNALLVQVPIDVDLPKRCEVKALLLSEVDLAPLCNGRSYFILP